MTKTSLLNDKLKKDVSKLKKAGLIKRDSYKHAGEDRVFTIETNDKDYIYNDEAARDHDYDLLKTLI